MLDDDIFTKLTGTADGAAVSAESFRIGPRPLDANDHLIYDSVNRVLLYDADGNGAGAAFRIAIFTAGFEPSGVGDFLVIP